MGRHMTLKSFVLETARTTKVVQLIYTFTVREQRLQGQDNLPCLALAAPYFILS